MPVLLARCLLGFVLAASVVLTPRTAEARRATTREAAGTPAEPGVAWTSGAEQGDCRRGRRKLWQMGEGWVVRTVTTCR